MTSRATASRYARALFEVGRAEGADFERVERELEEFSNLMTGKDMLHRALTNPAVPAGKKRAVVDRLVADAGMLLPVAKLLLLLAERDRLAMLPDLIEAFRNRLMDHMNVVRAEVVTAAPLPADSAAALQASLARATGRKVQFDARVDEAIVGGAVARLGGTVYDGSIARQLEKIRESLTSATD